MANNSPTLFEQLLAIDNSENMRQHFYPYLIDLIGETHSGTDIGQRIIHAFNFYATMFPNEAQSVSDKLQRIAEVLVPEQTVLNDVFIALKSIGVPITTPETDE